MAASCRAVALQALLTVLASWALPSWAVDGVVLIDQGRASAGGVTSGDAPGFPVSINQPGSYRLASNLVVPDGNTSAIEVNANHVTIDLNGFAILGPVDCSAGFPCANVGLQRGHGVVAGSDLPVRTFFDVSVRNGTISGMGADGVHLLGDNFQVRDLRIRDVGLSGILLRSTGVGTIGTDTLVRGNTIQRVGSYGIKTDAGVVVENAINACRSTGIWFTGGNGTVARNLVSDCGEFGLLAGPSVGYTGNTFAGNNGGGAQTGGGINTGQNVCGTGVCAGAQF